MLRNAGSATMNAGTGRLYLGPFSPGTIIGYANFVWTSGTPGTVRVGFFARDAGDAFATEGQFTSAAPLTIPAMGVLNSLNISHVIDGSLPYFGIQFVTAIMGDISVSLRVYGGGGGSFTSSLPGQLAAGTPPGYVAPAASTAALAAQIAAMQSTQSSLIQMFDQLKNSFDTLAVAIKQVSNTVNLVRPPGT